MRIPKEASAEVQKAFRELEEEIRSLKTGNVDLHKRRFVNAHRAVSRSDFLTKGDFDDAIADIQKKTVEAIRRIGRGSSGVGTGGSPTPTPTALPPPNHSMDFGYFVVDSIPAKGPDHGPFVDEVKGYTNIANVMTSFLGINFGEPGTTPQSDIQANLAAALQRITTAGLYIDLEFERGKFLSIDRILAAAAPFWSYIKYCTYAHEPSFTQSQMTIEITAFKNQVAQLGLDPRPVGVALTPEDVVGTDLVLSPALDYVQIWAYTVAPEGHGSSQADKAIVQARMDAMRAKVPATKKLNVVMQAYTRNNTFVNIVPDLVDLQRNTYLMVYQDTRVQALLMFSYGRDSGTRETPVLIPPHREIWGALQGSTGSPGGPGNPGATRCNQGRACCGGLGNEEDCPRWCTGGDYNDQVAASVSSFIASAPAGVMDPADPLHRILDIPAFMAGVVARINTDYPTVEAVVDPGHEGKEIMVKLRGSSAFSEQWGLWAGDKTVRSFHRIGGNAPQAYRATCYPARF